MPLSYFAQKYLMVSILTNISLLDVIGYNAWNSVPIENILLLSLYKMYLHSCFFFLHLFCCFILKFAVTIACAFTLKVGSSAPVAWACLLHIFNFINT